MLALSTEFSEPLFFTLEMATNNNVSNALGQNGSEKFIRSQLSDTKHVVVVIVVVATVAVGSIVVCDPPAYY